MAEDETQFQVKTSDRLISTRTVTIGSIPVIILIGIAVWYFAFRKPSAPPLTEKDTVLVADFVNGTGDQVFDDGLRQAVAVELQQSPFITLLSDQRLQRTLRSMQAPPDAAATGDVAREACRRAGATTTIEGSIVSSGPGFTITLTAHNCQTGASLASETTKASNKDDVLDKLGAAVNVLRGRIGEPAASVSKYNVKPADAMTKSLDALHAYGQGVRTRFTRGDDVAIPSFRAAIDKDPAFALAYAKLGVVSGNVGQLDEARADAKKAWELRSKVTEYERLYIDWNYASRVQEDEKTTREALERLTTTYPRDFAGRNNFGVYYNNRGEYEEALKQYRAATDIAPDEPGPISNAAYVLLRLGRIDDGSTSVDRALALRPDPNLAIARWLAARLGNHPRATEFEQVAKAMGTPVQIGLTESSIAAWEGRFKDYERIETELKSRTESSGEEDFARAIAMGERITRALYLQGRDVDALRSAMMKETDAGLIAQYVGVLAMLGDDKPARAALPTLLASPAAGSPQVAVSQAYVMSKDGKLQEAIALVQRAAAQNPRAPELQFLLGSLREQTGETKDAADLYKRVIDSAAAIGANPIIPTARLRLAQLLLKTGDTAGAKAQLDALLGQWKNADTQFPLLTETKALRAKIQ